MDKPAVLYNANRELNSTIVIQNGSPKNQWINRSIDSKKLSDRNKIRALLSTSSDGSTDKRIELPTILLPRSSVGELTLKWSNDF